MRISPEVEIALTLAQNEAARRRHEYFTLEHLLYALLFDESTAQIIRHAGGDPRRHQERARAVPLRSARERPRGELRRPRAPRSAVQRAIRRAAAHVQSSGKEQITGANVLVAIFAERDSPAVSILEKSGVTRLDVVAYISHGVSKAEEPDEGREKEAASLDGRGRGPALAPRPAEGLHDQPQRRGARRSASIRWSAGRTRSAASIQILARRKKNNPLLVGDSGVGKTAIVEGLALKIVAGDRPGRPQEVDGVLARHGRAHRRHALPRRVRGAAQGRREGAPEGRRRDPLHRRDPHDRRRRRDQRRQHGRVEPAQAGARLRTDALHRLDHVRGVPPALREGPRARRAASSASRSSSRSIEDTKKILEGLRGKYEEFHGVRYTDDALDAAATLSARYLHDRRLPDKAIDLLDEAGAAAKLKLYTEEKTPAAPLQLMPGPPSERTLDGADDGEAVALNGSGAPLENAPKTTRTGEAPAAPRATRAPKRRWRREGRRKTEDRRRSRRGRDGARAHGADPAARGQLERQGEAQEPRRRSSWRRLRSGARDQAARGGDQARARGAPLSREADRQLPPHRPHRRRKDGGRQAAREDHGHQLRALRHERVHGAPHRLAPHRRAAGLRRLRPGRPPHRRDREDPACRAPPRRDREGAPRRLQRAAPDHGPRQADRQQRQVDRFPPRHSPDDEQRRRTRPRPPRGRLRRAPRDGRRGARVQEPLQPRVP